ncbi:site-specific DNA-methyltransferase [Reichenbachiella sp. MALMAid0571]|uniref:DNA-methyltransferase n=1 Tax=Reichenbachiella sp. MALMAid0571 TaxID=3143939 RepID=UPI0032DFD892
MKDIYTVHNIDAREIDTVIKEPLVDVTITSPPYFDLKDYGSKNQIGYGQKYDDYLNDLELVFKKVYDATKETGTLWVIIDAFRRDGEVVPLPFDFSNKITQVGWKLQEVIIWGKDRTVPWAHKGQMRNLFEYVLMFSKTKEYNFYVDEVRDFQSLKKWWVKYPERYNPKGKTPDAIWHFDIPTQGSWGDGYIDHFCPLPEEMIAQILKLTTREGETVLDVFSGSGAVLAKADNMKRKYLGFELNTEYIEMFENYLKETGNNKKREYEIEEKNKYLQEDFRDLIINLRCLKFAKILYQKIDTDLKQSVSKIFVQKTNGQPEKLNAIVKCKYAILLIPNSDHESILESIESCIQKAPLSKFGVEPEFFLTSEIEEFKPLISKKDIYVYTNKVTHKYKRFLENRDLSLKIKNELILSEIKVELDEKDYE